jgi:endonuclease/exonuclease/phosphatase family metal-dependent hydrolase
MPSVRVGTFNCENLFARFKFAANVNPADVTANGFTIDKTKFTILKEEEKALTAKAILALNADVIGLQEVENLLVLRRFNSDRLKNAKYKHSMLVDGPDPRHIDVGVLSRFPIVHVRSYQHLREGNSAVFSRDCLEVDVDVGGKRLTLFVNHFKSMLGGRKQTRAKRLKQAKAVRQIVEDRFGNAPGDAKWIVLGDLNDFPEPDQGTTTALSDLVDWNQVENVIERLPQAQRFTHFFDGQDELRQLDYLLLSKSLAAATNAQPVLVRKGLSTNAPVNEVRFPGVTAKIAASDHCPFAIDLDL